MERLWIFVKTYASRIPQEEERKKMHITNNFWHDFMWDRYGALWSRVLLIKLHEEVDMSMEHCRRC